jgi:hypothetical protein
LATKVAPLIVKLPLSVLQVHATNVYVCVSQVSTSIVVRVQTVAHVHRFSSIAVQVIATSVGVSFTSLTVTTKFLSKLSNQSLTFTHILYVLFDS